MTAEKRMDTSPTGFSKGLSIYCTERSTQKTGKVLQSMTREVSQETLDYPSCDLVLIGTAG